MMFNDSGKIPPLEHINGISFECVVQKFIFWVFENSKFYKISENRVFAHLLKGKLNPDFCNF